MSDLADYVADYGKIERLVAERAGCCEARRVRMDRSRGVSRNKGKCGNAAYFTSLCPTHGGPSLEQVALTIYDEAQRTGQIPDLPPAPEKNC